MLRCSLYTLITDATSLSNVGMRIGWLIVFLPQPPISCRSVGAALYCIVMDMWHSKARMNRERSKSSMDTS
jgi:hypothetical protein